MNCPDCHRLMHEQPAGGGRCCSVEYDLVARTETLDLPWSPGSPTRPGWVVLIFDDGEAWPWRWCSRRRGGPRARRILAHFRLPDSDAWVRLHSLLAKD